MADAPSIVSQTPTAPPPGSNGAAPTPAPDEPTKVGGDTPDPLSPAGVDAEFADELAEAQREADGGAAQDDLEDFEWNGTPLRGPKGLKDVIAKAKDSAAFEAERKAFEAERTKFSEQTRESEADFEQRAQFANLHAQLQQYEQVDWAAWERQDPGGAKQGFAQYQQISREIGRLSNEIGERAQKRSQEAQRTTQERIKATTEFARKEIPGWKEGETDKQVVDFALSQGVQMDDLAQAMSPTIYKILWLARQGLEVTKKPAAVSAGQKPVPLTMVGAKGNAPARKSLADMNMDEYVAYRKRENKAGTH